VVFDFHLSGSLPSAGSISNRHAFFGTQSCQEWGSSYAQLLDRLIKAVRKRA
jgi:hypothetical protein